MTTFTKSCIVLVAVLLATTGVHAATFYYTWDGGSGNWFGNANWNTPGVTFSNTTAANNVIAVFDNATAGTITVNGNPYRFSGVSTGDMLIKVGGYSFTGGTLGARFIKFGKSSTSAYSVGETVFNTALSYAGTVELSVTNTTNETATVTLQNLTGSSAAAALQVAKGLTLNLASTNAIGDMSGIVVNGGSLTSNASYTFNKNIAFLGTYVSPYDLTFTNTIHLAGSTGVKAWAASNTAGVLHLSGTWSGGSVTGIQMNGPGTIDVSGMLNTLDVNYAPAGGAVRQNISGAGSFTGNHTLSGSGSGTGVMELTGGTYTRSLGTNAGQVSWGATKTGGFAAYGSDVAIKLNDDADTVLNWWFQTAGAGTANFMKDGNLVLGSITANAKTTVLNKIDLTGDNSGYIHKIRVVDNPNSTADVAEMAGVLSGTQGDNLNKSPLVKEGAGTLILSAANTYDGSTTVSAGTLLIDGSNSGGGLFSVAADAILGGKGSITLVSSNAVTLASGGNMALDIADGLDIVGGSGVALSGDNDLFLTGTLAAGQNYTVLTFAGMTGAFGKVYLNGVEQTDVSKIGGTHALTYNAGNLQLLVPEPATLGLLILGGLGVLVRRRK